MSDISTLHIYINEIKNNINYIKSKLENNQKYCFVAKADCYGVGVKLCKFIDSEVDCYAVSSADEFYKLKHYTKKEIIILDPIYENITKLAKVGVVFTVSNFYALSKIIQASKRTEVHIKIYIAVNTGMNRFGFGSINELNNLLVKIKKLQNISILGVFSHIYNANNENYTILQTKQFDKLVKFIKDNYNKKITVHLQATDATVLSKNHYDMVRIGMGCYTDKIFPTIKLMSKIIETHILNENDTAGYGGIFVAKKSTILATVAIGYGDGIFRNITGRGYVLINGEYAKIVAICMDSIIVDITNIDAKINDDVILIGKSGSKQIFICDVADWCDTINYEILTRISKRVKRIYIK